MGFYVSTRAMFGILVTLDDVAIPDREDEDYSASDYLEELAEEYGLELIYPGDCGWEETVCVVGYLNTYLFGWETPETLTKVSSLITSRMEEGRDNAGEMAATLEELQNILGLVPEPAQWRLVTNGG